MPYCIPPLILVTCLWRTCCFSFQSQCRIAHINSLKMSGNKDKEQSCTDGVRQQWSDFLEFVYDPRNGTVMGRNGKSWAKILIFYLFYYGFLAGLFAASVTIVRGTLDDYTPTYQTRLQTPGVGVQPKIPSNVEQSGNVIYTIPKPGEDATKNVAYSRLVNQITTFLKPYDMGNQTTENNYRSCLVDDPMQLEQQFRPGQLATSCTFDKSQLGPCANPPYGYDIGQPCLYIKLNRIINWFPVGYTTVPTEKPGDSSAPALSEILTAHNQPYRPYLMYTACYGFSGTDKANLNQNDWRNDIYYPTNMGLPFVYYPYHGKSRQPSYLSPLVAVQLTNVTRNAKIDIACKVYAKNIVDNKDMGEGYYRFDLQLNE